MKGITRFCMPTALLLIGLGACTMERQAQADNGMSFFITSVGAGQGADLGGLEGADRHCQQLAQSAGAGDRTWRAYLSTQAAGEQPAVNARDRIGPGPWRNAKATIIAGDVNELHGANNLTKETALTEKGDVAYVNELRPTLLTNVGSPWLQWLLITDAARPSQPARPFGAVQKAARRPCRVANTLIMRQRLAWPGCV